MYKLTMEFKTKEELLAHLDGGAVAASITTSIPTEVKTSSPTPAQKAAATRAKKKAAKDLEQATKVKEVVATAIAPTPVVAEAPAFDRVSALANVKARATELGTLGADESKVTEFFMNIFAELSIPPMKVDLLQDEQLSAFSEKFHAGAQDLVPVQAQASSFI